MRWLPVNGCRGRGLTKGFGRLSEETEYSLPWLRCWSHDTQLCKSSSHCILAWVNFITCKCTLIRLKSNNNKKKNKTRKTPSNHKKSGVAILKKRLLQGPRPEHCPSHFIGQNVLMCPAYTNQWQGDEDDRRIRALENPVGEGGAGQPPVRVRAQQPEVCREGKCSSCSCHRFALTFQQLNTIRVYFSLA